MGTPLEKIYDVFYSSINEDLSKHPELDVNIDDNIVVTYLEIAFGDFEENLHISLKINDDKSTINEVITNPQINILGRLMYKKYLERELNSSLRLSSHFNKRSELQVTGLQTKIGT
ncbi:MULTISPECIES: hypothetical protein [unclassified Paenibacillus]|uniref:hypothetical protein n=1 Tax=unclassified Paenibacillus TaxID=185978 RepID=UPI00020D7402|nr:MULTISPECIES: hypothetical protein [unclassified Paenibacillus]EGL17469.1 hypothetical protein HMPREF9413_5404 [Paenibacillus sp. HGF7]